MFPPWPQLQTHDTLEKRATSLPILVASGLHWSCHWGLSPHFPSNRLRICLLGLVVRELRERERAHQMKTRRTRFILARNTQRIVPVRRIKVSFSFKTNQLETVTNIFINRPASLVAIRQSLGNGGQSDADAR